MHEPTYLTNTHRLRIASVDVVDAGDMLATWLVACCPQHEHCTGVYGERVDSTLALLDTSNILGLRTSFYALLQAAEAASKLLGYTVDYVISSPFKRCLQTSAGAVRGLPDLPQGHWLVDWQLAEVC